MLERSSRLYVIGGLGEAVREVAGGGGGVGLGGYTMPVITTVAMDNY